MSPVLLSVLSKEAHSCWRERPITVCCSGAPRSSFILSFLAPPRICIGEEEPDVHIKHPKRLLSRTQWLIASVLKLEKSQILVFEPAKKEELVEILDFLFSSSSFILFSPFGILFVLYVFIRFPLVFIFFFFIVRSASGGHLLARRAFYLSVIRSSSPSSEPFTACICCVVCFQLSMAHTDTKASSHFFLRRATDCILAHYGSITSATPPAFSTPTGSVVPIYSDQ